MNNNCNNFIDMSKKSWVVLGPRRSGSRYICTLIKEYYYCHYETDIQIILPTESAVLTAIPEKTIVHAHSLSSFDMAGDHVQYVLSTRNLAESALSWCILLQTSRYHYTKSQFSGLDFFLNRFFGRRLITPCPFVLDPGVFTETYRAMQYWYDHMPKHIKDQAIIIDFSMIETAPQLILEKLGLNEKQYNLANFDTTIRAGGQHHEWIKNWNEITNVIKQLPAQNTW